MKIETNLRPNLVDLQNEASSEHIEFLERVRQKKIVCIIFKLIERTCTYEYKKNSRLKYTYVYIAIFENLFIATKKLVSRHKAYDFYARTLYKYVIICQNNIE